jgi:hypothetical protein
VRTCRCALGRPLFAGAVLVGSIPRMAPSDSSALTTCPRPSCGDVGKGLFTAACPEVIAAAVQPPKVEVVVAAAAKVVGEPLGVRYPMGPLVWRLFIPAGIEPESRL